jgi:hypothetical protein
MPGYAPHKDTIFRGSDKVAYWKKVPRFLFLNFLIPVPSNENSPGRGMNVTNNVTKYNFTMLPVPYNVIMIT